jgi:hypothetical protein
MEPDIPLAIHTKLACIAKRGRFSHIVNPRVWQAPDGRVIQRLDDGDGPLDEDFYDALVSFERQEEERISKISENPPAHQQRGENTTEPSLPCANGTENPRVPAFPNPSGENKDEYRDSAVTEKSIFQPGKRPIESDGTQVNKTVKNTKKNSSQSLLSWLKTSDSAETPPQRQDQVDKNTQSTAVVTIQTSSNVVQRQDPVDKDLGSASVVALQTSSNPAVPHHSPADCLIHRWAHTSRARCSVQYHSASDGAMVTPSSTPKTDSSIVTVILWVRYGCLRVQHNLALQQCQWVRQNIKNCNVTAVVFCPISLLNGTADGRAYLCAVNHLRTQLGQMGIEFFGIDGPEEALAAPVLALWTRQLPPIIGVFTTESYIPQATRTSSAVARSIRCPLFCFDAENFIPIRYLDTKLGTEVASSLSVQEFQAKAEPLSMPLPSVTFSVVPDLPVTITSSVPNVIQKRWIAIDWTKLETEFEGMSWKELGTDEVLTLDPELFLAHVRLGTVSPLCSVNEQKEIIYKRMLLLYKAWKNPQFPPSAPAENTGNVILEQLPTNFGIIRQRQWLRREEMEKLLASVSNIKDAYSEIDGIMRKHLVGFAAADTMAEIYDIFQTLKLPHELSSKPALSNIYDDDE